MNFATNNHFNPCTKSFYKKIMFTVFTIENIELKFKIW